MLCSFSRNSSNCHHLNCPGETTALSYPANMNNPNFKVASAAQLLGRAEREQVDPCNDNTATRKQALPENLSVEENYGRFGYYLTSAEVDYLSVELVRALMRLPTRESDICVPPLDSGYRTGPPYKDSCVFDTSLPGQAIKYHSRDFTLGSASTDFGGCSFLNLDSSELGNDGSLHWYLRIEVGEDRRQRFIASFSGELQSSRRERGRLGFASSVDITYITRRLAVEEFSRSKGKSYEAELGEHDVEVERNQEVTTWKRVSDMENESRRFEFINRDPIDTTYETKLLRVVLNLCKLYSRVLVFGPSRGEPKISNFMVRYSFIRDDTETPSQQDILAIIKELEVAKASSKTKIYAENEELGLFLVALTSGPWLRNESESWFICFVTDKVTDKV